MKTNTIQYSLRIKFIFLISGMFVVMALALSLVFYNFTREHFHKTLIEKGTILVKDLAYNSIYGLIVGDSDILDILIRGVIEQPDVSFVVIYGPDGKERAVVDVTHVRWSLPEGWLTRVSASNEPIVSIHNAGYGRVGNAYYEIIAPVVRKTELEGASGIGLEEKNASPGDSVIGAVRVGLSLKALHQDLQRIVWVVLLFTIGIIGMGVTIAIFFVRRITSPVSEMVSSASRIASGDFTQKVQVRSRDEVGILGNTFNRMIADLKGVIGKIQEASNSVVSTARQMGLSSNKVTEGAQVQARSIEAIFTSIEEINTSIRDVARSIDLLSSAIEASSSSILEMDASINEVAKNTGVLDTAIEETSSSILEMSTSIQQVAEHSGLLSQSVEGTLSAAKEIDISVSAVAMTAKKSAVLSGKLREDAEKMGLGAVHKTRDGMVNIRNTMSDLSKAVNRLGERSEQIGGILTMIDEVTDQTTLLALNASILAAQSGEHGRGFAVVAGEIKELADRTTASTKEISQLISDVQNEVHDAIQLTNKGISTVEEGVSLSSEADTTFRQILESAGVSMSMAKQIELATIEQSKGIRQVTESIQQNSEMVHEIARATQELGFGTQKIMEATEKMRDTSKIVRQAMVEQARGSRQIAETATHVSTRVQEIAVASNEQTREGQKIIHSIEEIRSITQRNTEVASEMAAAVNVLARQSEILEEQIRNFKI
ncbi:MAG: HAMP domain-containing protein [Nitrospirae bacterium]|nr:HAMP domain-containing protein [Nitrospirota bacterium]